MGVDVGTSGCKCVLLLDNGEIFNTSYKEYNMQSNAQGEYELNPDEVWKKASQAISECAFKIKSSSEKLVIAISSCGESFIMLDNNKKELSNAMLCSDLRGSDELHSLLCKISKQKIMELTGIPAHEMYSIVKLLWQRKNKPEIYEKCRYILQFEDFINFKLTGEMVTDYSMAARTMAFNIHNKDWDDTILKAAGINREIFPAAVPSGRMIGKALKSMIEVLGLPRDTFVAAGGHDQSVTALGAGVINIGTAVDGMGSSECISAILPELSVSEKMLKSSYNCGIHAAPNRYLSLGFTFSAGTLVKWFCSRFAGEYKQIAASKGESVYKYLDEAASKKPTGIFVLPHFNGAGTPYMDTESKGVIAGLTIGHTMADIYRAVLEGVSYEICLNIEQMEKAGISVQSLRAVGGGAKSKLWLQMKADMLGRKIETVSFEETSALGASICAGVSGGAYSSFEEAVQKLVKVSRTYIPNMEIHKRYQVLYDNYKKLYPSIRPVFNK